MAGILKRHVHVFNASNGNEVAGTFTGLELPSFFSNPSTGSSRDHIRCLYPSQLNINRAVGGPAARRKSLLDVTSFEHFLLVPRIILFVLCALNTNLFMQTAPVAMFLTTDFPRTRAYAVNYTYTSLVRSIAYYSTSNLLEPLGNGFGGSS
jgi:hypothetical protein